MLSEQGYKRETYAEILEGVEQLAKENFGEDIDTSEPTILGKLLRIFAYYYARLAEENEEAYYSAFANFARGVSLDRVCELARITRNSETASAYTIQATGTANKPIPYGFLVGTEDGITFYNTQKDVVFNYNGKATFTAECTDKGVIGNVPLSEINTIINTDVNVSSIEAIEQTAIGTKDENDYSLRRRFNLAKKGLGACNESSILASVLAVPDVSYADIVVNESNSTDSNTLLPAHSFKVIVRCPTTAYQEVAQAIYNKKPLGIATVGDISLYVMGINNYHKRINFSIPTTISVKVTAKINVDSSLFPTATGTDEIETAIKEYINTLGIGNNVSRSSLYGIIHSVSGVTDVTELKMYTVNGSTETEVSGNIEVTYDKDTVCSSVEVTVNV